MLKLNQVSKRFGGLTVLQDVSFDVPSGSVFGLIGPNGAGKTTVFNLITGLLAPSGGGIALEGCSLVGVKPHQITRLGLARTFQNIRIFREMTLLENVIVGMHAHLDYSVPGWLFALPGFRAREAQAREKALELLSWVGLSAKAGDIADNLSYGDQRKLELARALATEPKLLLLDEPAGGLGHDDIDDLAGLITSLPRRGAGCTVMLVEHHVDLVMSVCDTLVVLDFGKVIAHGTPNEVRNDPAVAEAYLGAEVAS